MFSRNHDNEPVHPARSAITVAGIVGVSANNRRTAGSTSTQAELVTAGRSYLGGRSAANADATVARAIPNCLAIARCDNPSPRCNRLIKAQSSNEITHPILVRWPSFRPAKLA